jgi:hypothetical protein
MKLKLNLKSKLIQKSGYKYQVGWFTTDGNYKRIAIFKKKPSSATINRLSKDWNIPFDRIQSQLIQ